MTSIFAPQQTTMRFSIPVPAQHEKSTTRHPTSTWTERALAGLRELAVPGGGSTGTIAAILRSRFAECANVTRGSILGKCFRLGIALPDSIGSRPQQDHSARAPRDRAGERQRARQRAITTDGYDESAQPTTRIRTRAAASAGGNEPRRQSLTKPSRATATALNAPGRLPPKRDKTEVQSAAALLEQYHAAFISVRPSTPAVAETEERQFAEFWPERAPRAAEDGDDKFCSYPTVYDAATRTQLFCGCQSVAKQAYCGTHRRLCSA